jgi:hypothetical protein
MASDGGAGPATRLSDLARARPGDRTFENLLRALSAQMDLCSSMTVFRYEAQLEGHQAAVDAFETVARTERCSFEQLVACLQAHLDEHPPPSKATTQRSAR